MYITYLRLEKNMNNLELKIVRSEALALEAKQKFARIVDLNISKLPKLISDFELHVIARNRSKLAIKFYEWCEKLEISHLPKDTQKEIFTFIVNEVAKSQGASIAHTELGKIKAEGSSGETRFAIKFAYPEFEQSPESSRPTLIPQSELSDSEQLSSTSTEAEIVPSKINKLEFKSSAPESLPKPIQLPKVIVNEPEVIVIPASRRPNQPGEGQEVIFFEYKIPNTDTIKEEPKPSNESSPIVSKQINQAQLPEKTQSKITKPNRGIRFIVGSISTAVSIILSTTGYKAKSNSIQDTNTLSNLSPTPTNSGSKPSPVKPPENKIKPKEDKSPTQPSKSENCKNSSKQGKMALKIKSVDSFNSILKVWLQDTPISKEILSLPEHTGMEIEESQLNQANSIETKVDLLISKFKHIESESKLQGTKVWVNSMLYSLKLAKTGKLKRIDNSLRYDMINQLLNSLTIEATDLSTPIKGYKLISQMGSDNLPAPGTALFAASNLFNNGKPITSKTQITPAHRAYLNAYKNMVNAQVLLPSRDLDSVIKHFVENYLSKENGYVKNMMNNDKLRKPFIISSENAIKSECEKAKNQDDATGFNYYENQIEKNWFESGEEISRQNQIAMNHNPSKPKNTFFSKLKTKISSFFT